MNFGYNLKYFIRIPQMNEQKFNAFHEAQIKQFGMRLKQIRKEKKMSQVQLEEVSGIYISEISKMENGLQNITFQTLSRLAFVLKVEIQEFFKFELLDNKS